MLNHPTVRRTEYGADSQIHVISQEFHKDGPKSYTRTLFRQQGLLKLELTKKGMA